MKTRTFAVRGLAALLSGPLLLAQAPAPLRLVSGSLPPLPETAVGGGEVILRLGVTAQGRVGSVDVLRETPPFLGGLMAAVRNWTFTHAPKPDAPPAAVLVAAVYRPPSIVGPTLGEHPRDNPLQAPDVPFPTVLASPAYPPKAVRGASVLVEARVNQRGDVVAVRVVRGASPLDSAAVAAAWQWRFRPAAVSGGASSSLVYLIFGFATPVT